MDDTKRMFEHEKLLQAVRDYLNERDNPVPDYALRRVYIKRMRDLVGIPEPSPSR